MNYYELVAILPGQIMEPGVKEIQERILKLVTTSGFEVARVEELGKLKLAYPLQQLRHGFYLRVVGKGEASLVAALRKLLQLEDGICRFELGRIPESAVHRNYQLTAYQEPVVERDRDRDQGYIRRERVFVPSPAAPVKPMSDAEVDAQIEKILEEKVL